MRGCTASSSNDAPLAGRQFNNLQGEDRQWLYHLLEDVHLIIEKLIGTFMPQARFEKMAFSLQ